MPMTINIAQARLRREVPAAEKALDEALLRLTEVMRTILVARQEADVPVHAGQNALIRLVRSQQDLVSASNNMFRTHDALADLGRELCGPDENYSPKSAVLDEALESTAQAA